MNENDKERFIAFLSLKGELDSVSTKGTGLYIDGRNTGPDYIASVCVFNEGADYMRDYASRKKQYSNRLCFDEVREN